MMLYFRNVFFLFCWGLFSHIPVPRKWNKNGFRASGSPTHTTSGTQPAPSLASWTPILPLFCSFTRIKGFPWSGYLNPQCAHCCSTQHVCPSPHYTGLWTKSYSRGASPRCLTPRGWGLTDGSSTSTSVQWLQLLAFWVSKGMVEVSST